MITLEELREIKEKAKINTPEIEAELKESERKLQELFNSWRSQKAS